MLLVAGLGRRAPRLSRRASSEGAEAIRVLARDRFRRLRITLAVERLRYYPVEVMHGAAALRALIVHETSVARWRAIGTGGRHALSGYATTQGSVF